MVALVNEKKDELKTGTISIPGSNGRTLNMNIGELLLSIVEARMFKRGHDNRAEPEQVKLYIQSLFNDLFITIANAFGIEANVVKIEVSNPYQDSNAILNEVRNFNLLVSRE